MGLPRWWDLGDPEVILSFLKKAFTSYSQASSAYFIIFPHPLSPGNRKKLKMQESIASRICIFTRVSKFVELSGNYRSMRKETPPAYLRC